MRSSLLPLFVLTVTTTALPTPTNTLDWSPALAEFYTLVDHHITLARSAPHFPSPPACDFTHAAMPVGPTPLPAPAAGSHLLHVAIGRGVQNYTCANSSAVPVSIGAVASLFNASCIASNYPDLLSLLPNLALQYPLPDPATGSATPGPGMELSGHHFFTTPTTPTFNLDADPTLQLGVVSAKKLANSTAPAGSPKGQDGVGNGSVAWLYLQAQSNATQGPVVDVYRLNTAGGAPPATCAGMESGVFSVQYAAEYWFWGS